MVQTKSRVSTRAVKFLRLPLSSKVLLLEAWITLGLSRGMVLTLPFRWIAPGLRARLSGSVQDSGQAHSPDRGLGPARGQQVHPLEE